MVQAVYSSDPAITMSVLDLDKVMDGDATVAGDLPAPGRNGEGH